MDDLTLDDIDIWAMRHQGYLDAELLDLVRARGAALPDIAPDYETAPSTAQRRAVLAAYRRLADKANTRRFGHRTDWTPRELWQVGRARTMQAFGG